MGGSILCMLAPWIGFGVKQWVISDEEKYSIGLQENKDEILIIETVFEIEPNLNWTGNSKFGTLKRFKCSSPTLHRGFYVPLSKTLPGRHVLGLLLVIEPSKSAQWFLILVLSNMNVLVDVPLD